MKTSKKIKTRTIKDMIFDAAVLAAVGAIALYAKQASAFGMIGAGAAVGVSARAGGIGAVRPESMGSRGGASNIAGAITMNGITVLPNGTLIVPAVTARTIKAAATASNTNQLNPQNPANLLQPSSGPCKTPVCKP